MRHESGPECPNCKEKLKQAHPDIAAWFRRVKARYVNVHISDSFRNMAAQNKAYETGHSRLRWPKSKHNHMEQALPCALALDLFLIDEDGLARFPPLFYARLNADNERDREPIEWGGTWKTFKDMPHFQLIPTSGPQVA